MAQAVQFAILGLGAGAAYTLLAQGIVLIYRGSGIVNFADGGIAMFGAFFCFLTLVEQHGWPIESAIPVSVLIAALLGIAIQNGILRFMRDTAPLVRLVATLGVLIVLQGLAGQKLWDIEFHQIDQFLPTHNYTLHEWFGFHGDLGRVVIQQDRLILLGIAILLTVALWAFTRTRGWGSRSLRARRTSGRWPRSVGHPTSWRRSPGPSVVPPRGSPASCWHPTPVPASPSSPSS